MPLPRPAGKEDEKSFMSRCMGDTKTGQEFPDNKQRVAVCMSQWRKSKATELTDEEAKALGLIKLDEKVNKI